MMGTIAALVSVAVLGLASVAPGVAPPGQGTGPAQMPPVSLPGFGMGAGPLPIPGANLIGAPPGVLGQPMGSPPGMSGPSRAARSDISYGPEARHRLDLYLPSINAGATNAGAAPVVMFIHGGGWAIGDKTQFGWVGEQLAAQGVVAAVINYRLSPQVVHPAHTQDVAKALAWVYRNIAQYGGNPNSLYVSGHSAGAHMAALVTLDKSYLAAESLNPAIVKGVIGIAGPTYDLDSNYAQTPIAPLLFPVFGPDTSKWTLAAPVRYVQPYAPSFLLVYGTSDNQALPLSTQSLAGALQRNGVPSQVEPMQGQDHFGVLNAAMPVLRRFVQ